MNRLLLEPAELADGGEALLVDDRARHLLEVLRVAVGDRVRVGLLDGPRGEGRVEGIEAGRVRLVCDFEAQPPARPRVDLILACPRPKVLRRLWAPLAGLGVGHVALTNAWRVERNYFDSHLLRPEGFRPLLVEGLAQAGCTRLPTVSVHKRLVALLADELASLAPGAARLLAHPGGARTVRQAIRTARPERVLVAIGPEGGWIERELSLFARHGFVAVATGPRILRSDVACCVLLGLVHAALDDA